MFRDGLYRGCVDTRQRNHVAVCAVANHGMILPVIVRGELVMSDGAIARDAVHNRFDTAPAGAIVCVALLGLRLLVFDFARLRFHVPPPR